MGLEDRDWYWKDRKRRAKRYNPADPAGDLPDEPQKKLTKARWEAFKRSEAERVPQPESDLVWNNRKSHVEREEPARPKTQTAQSRWVEPPPVRVKTKQSSESLKRTIYNLKWLLAGSVIINIMAFHAFYRLAHPL